MSPCDPSPETEMVPWNRESIMNVYCYYCGVPLCILTQEQLKGRSNPANLRTKDHKQPRSAGGKEVVDCCLACNNEKGMLSLEEWRAVLMYRAGHVNVERYKFCGELQP